MVYAPPFFFSVAFKIDWIHKMLFYIFSKAKFKVSVLAIASAGK